MPPLASGKVSAGVEADEVAVPVRPRGRFLRNVVAVLGDLFVAWDCVAVLAAAYIAWLAMARFGTSFAPGEPMLPEAWAAVRPDALMAACAAPFVLREHRPAWTSNNQRSSNLVPRALSRVAILLGLIWSIEIIGRISGNLPIAWLGLWSFGIVALTVQPRALLVGYLRRLEAEGGLLHSVAVIGAGPSADRLMRQLRASHGSSVEIVGLYDDRAERVPSGSVMPHGSVEDLIVLAQTRRVDWVVITLPWTADGRVVQILHRVKALAVEVTLCPPLVGNTLVPGEVDMFQELPSALISRRPLQDWGVLLKELEDKVLGGLLILGLLPVFGLLALAVRLDSPGPVFFRQKRVGLNNCPFDILKFRSMRWQPDASADIKQTQRDDRRITAVGKYLRKTSLDELPQLFNVLRGEMSLVGPRPHAVTMRTQELLGDEIIEQYKHRHRMKPGITGWAQIHGLRGATETVDQLRARVEHDIWYIDRWSLWLDIKILLLTPVKILGAKNAF